MIMLCEPIARPGIPSFQEHFEKALARGHRFHNRDLDLDNGDDRLEMLVCSTDNFYVVMGIGIYADTYLLIVTKDKYGAMAELPDAKLGEFYWIHSEMLDLLQRRARHFDKHLIAQFEHGTANPDSTAACCTQENAHTHLMLLPGADHTGFEAGVRQAVESRKIGMRLRKLYSMPENLSPLKSILQKGKSYVYAASAGDGWTKDFCLLGEVPKNTSPSQLIRQGTYLSLPDEWRKGRIWDWQIYVGPEPVYVRSKLFWLAFHLWERQTQSWSRQMPFNFVNHMRLES